MWGAGIKFSVIGGLCGFLGLRFLLMTGWG